MTVTVMLVNSSCDASSAAKSPIAFVPSTPALAVDMTEESVLSTMYSTVTQGLTLVPVTARLELFRPPYNPNYLMNVSWSCSS